MDQGAFWLILRHEPYLFIREVTMYIIDRFEGEWAIVETENRSTFNLPRNILPIDLKEGDVISIQINADPIATIERSKKAKSLLDNFFDE